MTDTRTIKASTCLNGNTPEWRMHVEDILRSFGLLNPRERVWMQVIDHDAESVQLRFFTAAETSHRARDGRRVFYDADADQVVELFKLPLNGKNKDRRRIDLGRSHVPLLNYDRSLFQWTVLDEETRVVLLTQVADVSEESFAVEPGDTPTADTWQSWIASNQGRNRKLKHLVEELTGTVGHHGTEERRLMSSRIKAFAAANPKVCYIAQPLKKGQKRGDLYLCVW
ncbi:MAG TPA: hypothetical protein VIG24_07765 [Acidimicrobiia bacterium]